MLVRIRKYIDLNRWSSASMLFVFSNRLFSNEGNELLTNEIKLGKIVQRWKDI